MSVIWAKVWFDLWHNKVRTLLAVLSISAGVFAVGAMFGMSDQLLSGMDNAHRAVSPSHINMFLDRRVTRSYAESLTSVEGVEDIEAYEGITVRYKTSPDSEWKEGIIALRDDYEHQKYDMAQLKEGRWPGKDDIGIERLSSQYFGLNIGDPVIFKIGKSEKSLPISGKIRYPFVPPPQFGGQAYFFVNGPGAERFGVPDGEFSALLIRVKPYSTDYAKEVATAIKDRLGKDGIGAPAVIYQDPDKHWGRMFVEGITLVLQVLAIVSLIMSVVLVFNTLTGIITQQIDQIGIIKAVGGTSATIIKVYLTGVLVYGLLSLFVSLPLGMFVAFGISQWFLNLFNIDYNTFRFSQLAVGLQVGAAIAVPLLAGLIPVLQGAAITVREAIASYGLGGDFGTSRLDRAVERLGARLLPSHYATALGNMFRRKGRLILTQLVLITAGTMFLIVMALSSSITFTLDEEFGRRGYDATIWFNNNQRIDRLIETAKSVEGVTQGEVWYTHSATVLKNGQHTKEAGLGSELDGLPADSPFYKPLIVAGRWLTPGDGRVIVMNRETADKNKIQVGDTVTLDLHELGKDDWQVIGLYQVIFGGGFSTDVIYAPQDAMFESIKKYNLGGMLYVAMREHDAAYTKNLTLQLKDTFEGRGMKVAQTYTVKELLEQANGQFGIFVGMLLALACIVAIVGGIGLMGALSISVVERTKEIGVLRAVGARSPTIMLMFVMEGVLQGIFSWIVSVLVSLLVSQPLAQALGQVMFSTNLFYQYNQSAVLIWLIAVIIISTFASIIPARNATRISVRASLAYT
jgi:putative ABC transport system permease protein